MDHNTNYFHKSSIVGSFDVFVTHFHRALTCECGLGPHECSGLRRDKASDCVIMASLPGFT